MKVLLFGLIGTIVLLILVLVFSALCLSGRISRQEDEAYMKALKDEADARAVAEEH